MPCLRQLPPFFLFLVIEKKVMRRVIYYVLAKQVAAQVKYRVGYGM